MTSSEQRVDQDQYALLEQHFRAQVICDHEHTISRVKEGWGVYLPVEQPTYLADYVLIGMEPSMGFAENAQDAEQRVVKGKNINFGWPSNNSHVLALFLHSIAQFLCAPQEHHYLTDLSKGAMMVEVAAIDRYPRYVRWYELLLHELRIVAKQGAPVIAIGGSVFGFLRGRKFTETTKYPLYEVTHYSPRNWRIWSREAEARENRDEFMAFQRNLLNGPNSPWPTTLPNRKQMLVYAYFKQFSAIRANEKKEALLPLSP